MGISIVLCVVLYFTFANARSDQELKQEFIKIVMKCTETNPVGVSEIMALQNLVVPTDMESKCLLACAYRKLGTMNAKGLYDLNKAMAIADLETSDDPARYENSKKLANICVKVNEEKVSDGEKGCERAALMFKCLVEHAPKLGFKI